MPELLLEWRTQCETSARRRCQLLLGSRPEARFAPPPSQAQRETPPTGESLSMLSSPLSSLPSLLPPYPRPTRPPTRTAASWDGFKALPQQVRGAASVRRAALAEEWTRAQRLLASDGPAEFMRQVAQGGQ
jgi:hypothetical protein